MAKKSDRWWTRFLRRHPKNGKLRQPSSETRRLVRKALATSTARALPPSAAERVPADLRQKLPKHTQHIGGGHVHFYREHLLFKKTVVRKDPITRKFKRTKQTGRQDGYYNANGGLHEDKNCP